MTKVSQVAVERKLLVFVTQKQPSSSWVVSWQLNWLFTIQKPSRIIIRLKL